jgi:hypothetical protein
MKIVAHTVVKFKFDPASKRSAMDQLQEKLIEASLIILPEYNRFFVVEGDIESLHAVRLELYKFIENGYISKEVIEEVNSKEDQLVFRWSNGCKVVFKEIP